MKILHSVEMKFSVANMAKCGSFFSQLFWWWINWMDAVACNGISFGIEESTPFSRFLQRREEKNHRFGLVHFTSISTSFAAFSIAMKLRTIRCVQLFAMLLPYTYSHFGLGNISKCYFILTFSVPRSYIAFSTIFFYNSYFFPSHCRALGLILFV